METTRSLGSFGTLPGHLRLDPPGQPKGPPLDLSRISPSPRIAMVLEPTPTAQHLVWRNSKEFVLSRKNILVPTLLTQNCEHPNCPSDVNHLRHDMIAKVFVTHTKTCPKDTRRKKHSRGKLVCLCEPSRRLLFWVSATSLGHSTSHHLFFGCGSCCARVSATLQVFTPE